MKENMNIVTRRQFLGATGSIALALQATSSLAHNADNAARDSSGQMPKDVNRKFHEDGTVEHFAGNTFIGHIEQQGKGFEGFDTLLTAYRNFPKYSFKDKIALLPPSSYHITVFVGVNDEDRTTVRWHHDLDRATPIDKITDEMTKVLQGLTKKQYAPFEFVVDEVPSLKKEGTLHIPFKPADKATELRLRTIRDELSEITGIRDKDHDRYQYHMTLGYIHHYLSATEAEQLQQLTKECMQKIAGLKRKIQIPTVEFCRFNDMYAFEVLHRL